MAEPSSDGLLIGIEADYARLARSLAKANAETERRAKQMEDRFKRSNKAIADSAEDSAKFIAQEMDRLRAKYDPVFAASKRYEAAVEDLSRAQKVGAIDARTYEAALDRLNREYAAASGPIAQATDATEDLNATMRGLDGSAAGLGGNGLRMVSLQLSQVAQQGAITGNYLQALSIQMPDLLLAFGTWGALVGAAAAVLSPFILNLIQTEEEVQSLEDAIQSATQALDNLERFSAQNIMEGLTGATMQAVTAFNDLLGVIERVESRALSGALQKIREDAFGIRQALQAFEAQSSLMAQIGADAPAFDVMGLDTLNEAYFVLQQMQRISGETRQEILQSIEGVAEALRLRGVMTEEIEDQLATLAQQFDVVEAINETQGQINAQYATSASRLQAIYGLYQNVRGQADALLTTQRAINSEQVRERLGRQEEPVVLDPRDPRFDPVRAEFARLQAEDGNAAPRLPASGGGGGGGRTGGGGGSSQRDPVTGYDPALLSVIAERVTEVTASTESLQKANQALQKTAGDAFLSLVTGAESAREVIGNLLDDLARLFAQAAFQNLVSGVGGSSAFGGLGSLLRTFDGGGFTGMGARAGGIDGKGGFPAILHPNETIVDHTKGGRGMVVNVAINIDAKGSGDSGRGAMGAVPQIRAAVVAAVADAQRRGYRG